MLDREINPIDFADLVKLNAQKTTPQKNIKDQFMKKNINLADIVLIMAIVAVAFFFLMLVLL
jgi:hypothetical protein